jgi:hypothetical protein
MATTAQTCGAQIPQQSIPCVSCLIAKVYTDGNGFDAETSSVSSCCFSGLLLFLVGVFGLLSGFPPYFRVCVFVAEFPSTDTSLYNKLQRCPRVGVQNRAMCRAWRLDFWGQALQACLYKDSWVVLIELQSGRLRHGVFVGGATAGGCMHVFEGLDNIFVPSCQHIIISATVRPLIVLPRPPSWSANIFAVLVQIGPVCLCDLSHDQASTRCAYLYTRVPCIPGFLDTRAQGKTRCSLTARVCQSPVSRCRFWGRVLIWSGPFCSGGLGS